MKITEGKLDYYLGELEECYFGYAKQESIKSKAASGGLVTLLSLYLLRERKIDGVVVTSVKTENGQLKAFNYIAKNEKEILAARGSIYMDFNYFNIISEIENFQGKLAIVALPCQIIFLKELMKKNKKLKEKIGYTIGLFCGHLSRPELIHQILKKNKIAIGEIEEFKFRTGHWRGEMKIKYKNKEEKKMDFKKFSVYQNLFFYSAEKCLYCCDHTSEKADISMGDIWSRKMKKNPTKHNAIITRNAFFDEILKQMEEKKLLYLKGVSKKEIFKAQKRSLFFHKHIKARQIVGKVYGYKIVSNPSKNNLARWNDIVASFFIMLNIKISKSSFFSKIIFIIPEKLLLLYLYFIKFFVNF